MISTVLWLLNVKVSQEISKKHITVDILKATAKKRRIRIRNPV